jgi:hypothetical protein
MRPATPIFVHGADLPAHLSDLRGQLVGGGSQAPPDELGLPSALEELGHVCASASNGRLANDDDRASLIADLAGSIDGLGPDTMKAAAPELANFRGDLRFLHTRLRSAEGARTVGLALGSLGAALRRSEVAVAAWRDTVAAFGDEQASPEICETRILNLRELAELRGHFWEPQGLASHLQSVLSDILAQTSQEPATPIEQRLARCEDLIRAQPPVADCAVWFVFGDADLTTTHLAVGPLLFIPREFVPEAFAPGRALHNVGPLPELAHWADAEIHLTQIPVERVVLARVWLPNTFADQAPTKARAVLESLLDIAKPASRWKLYEGHMMWCGGEHFGGSSFMDVDQWERESPPVSPFLEGTDRALTDFNAEFVQRLADEDAIALEAVEDARWTIALGRAPDALQRVALGTRALERTLGIVRAEKESWPDVTTRFLKAPWVRLTLANEMVDAAIAATYGLPGRYTHNAETFKEIHDLVLPSNETEHRSVDFAALATVQATYGHLWEPNALSRKIVRDASAVLTDPKATVRALIRLESRFDLLIARTRRQRNALIHGTRPSQDVINTIDEFVQTLNAYMAQESLRTAETGQAPLHELERWRIDALVRRQRLEQGDNPVEVLFSNA